MTKKEQVVYDGYPLHSDKSRSKRGHSRPNWTAWTRMVGRRALRRATRANLVQEQREQRIRVQRKRKVMNFALEKAFRTREHYWCEDCRDWH